MASLFQPLSPTFVRLTRDGMVWDVREGFQELVPGSGTPWFDLRAERAAQLVKTGDHRMVWRVRDPKKGPVYVKLFHAPGFMGRVRARFSGSPARREAGALKEAEHRGILAVAVLAVGDRRADGSSVLITHEQPNALPLPAVWDKARSRTHTSQARQARLDILACTAKLLTQSWQKGLIQLDGHPGNILVANLSDGRLEASYVDLARCAWSKGPAPERPQVEAIAQLYQYAFDKTTRCDRLRFVRECVRRCRPPGAGDDWIRAHQRRLIRLIEPSRARTADRLARHRDRRLRRDGKYFHRISLEHGWRGTVVICLARRHRFPERGVPDRSLQEWQRQLEPLIAAGESQAKAGGLRDAGPLFVRPIRAPSLVDALLWTIGGSPARRVFERCHRLRHRDERAPLLLGYLERRGGGLGGVRLVREAFSIEDRTGAGNHAGSAVGKADAND